MGERENRIDYDTIAAAVKGNMIAVGMILESYSRMIDIVIHKVAPWLSEECRRDCRQEVFIELIRLIQTKFTV